MDQGRVSINYARALLQWAADNSVEQEVYEQSKILTTLLKDSPDILLLLQSTLIPSSKKIQTLELAIQKAIPQLFNFLTLVVKNNRTEQLSRILHSYGRLHRDKNGIIRAFVESSQEMGPKSREGLIAYLANHFNKSVEISFSTKPELIGGFVLTIEDQMLDKSVRNELNLLHKRLTEIVS